MIKQFFTQPKVLSRLQEGVFGPYLPAFAAALHEEGYSRGCIRRHLRAADHFGVWLTDRRLTVGDLTRATLDRYIEGEGRLYSASTPNGRLPHSAQGLHELLEFLTSQGMIVPAVETPLTSAGKWLAEFDSHLDRTLGCAPRSRSNYLLYARRFLDECFGDAEIEWQKLSAAAFYAISGRDLDELEAQDFATILIWLKGGGVERTLKTPRPYQVEALDDILAVLRYEDRATVLMACGTGKTLAALWVCERMGAQNILVLVPLLALLRQTLHESMRQTAWPSVARLCVCSDPSVRPEIDQIVLRPEDLDFPVTTYSGDVRTFLATEFLGVKLVFSTYQSAHVVAEGMKRGQSFDLALFDEARLRGGNPGKPEESRSEGQSLAVYSG